MAKLVLTLIGDDREGLVSGLSRAVAEHGGNWLEGQLGRLAGKFAGVVLVDIPDEREVDFRAAAAEVDGLDVHVTTADDAEELSGTPMALHLVGNDRVGIVREVTGVLASLGVSIDEMHTSTRPAPMADTVLFEAAAQLRLPEGTDSAKVREALEQIAAELIVDLELDESQDNA